MGSFVLMWKKDDRVLTAGNLVVRKDSRLQLRNDFSLEINSLKPEDQGPYICEIDVMGQAITIDHTVFFANLLYEFIIINLSYKCTVQLQQFLFVFLG